MHPYPPRAEQADAPAPTAAHLNRRQLAARLGVSERTVWAETHAGRIPHLRVGVRIVYPLATIAEWEHAQAMASLRPAEPARASMPRTRRRRVVQALAEATPATGRQARPVRPDDGGEA